jgi:hypothetical protein
VALILKYLTNRATTIFWTTVKTPLPHHGPPATLQRHEGTTPPTHAHRRKLPILWSHHPPPTPHRLCEVETRQRRGKEMEGCGGDDWCYSCCSWRPAEGALWGPFPPFQDSIAEGPIHGRYSLRLESHCNTLSVSIDHGQQTCTTFDHILNFSSVFSFTWDYLR